MCAKVFASADGRQRRVVAHFSCQWGHFDDFGDNVQREGGGEMLKAAIQNPVACLEELGSWHVVSSLMLVRGHAAKLYLAC